MLSPASTTDVVRTRTAFAQWLRTERDRLVTPGHAEALAALGLDDATLDAFASAPSLLVNLPHASPNVFFPRAHVAWYVRHRMRLAPDVFGLRVTLTHVNFSDLGWRPYAWWYLDAAGELRRETLFSRNKRRKHVVVSALGPLSGVPDGVTGTDADAARLATCAADRATSHMLVSAAVERAAGLAPPGRSLSVPLPSVIRFLRDEAPDPRVRRWAAAVVGGSDGARRVDGSGRLVAAPAGEALVFANAVNIALLAALGPADVVGGAKMDAYWHEVDAVLEDAERTTGLRAAPLTHTVTPGPADHPVTPSPALAPKLAEAGIGYSQGMALAEHGRFGETVDPWDAPTN